MAAGETLEVEIESEHRRKIELVAAHRRAEVAAVTQSASGKLVAVLRKL